MADEKDRSEEDPRSAVERLLARDLDEVDGVGRPLSRRARQTRRSVEAYLQAGVRPRWMERLGEIDAGIANETRRLERAYEALREEHRGDREAFARRWRALARSWSFESVNELIRQHNEWFPIERQLPVDPRTRDYVLVGGRNYRRAELGPQWVLEKFPADRT
jgi:hypothetical protein